MCCSQNSCTGHTLEVDVEEAEVDRKAGAAKVLVAGVKLTNEEEAMAMEVVVVVVAVKVVTVEAAVAMEEAEEAVVTAVAVAVSQLSLCIASHRLEPRFSSW